ncbi:DUF4153 domain-containing protein, partial [Romboutsia sp.]|uniref:DUF4153 domain-containing protein n=1 Tax=Romboutsia sp. TaxID=1965302 RepID=UPI002C9B75DD
LSLAIDVFFEGNTNIKKYTQILSYVGIAILLIVYYLLFLRNVEMESMTRYVAYTIAFYLLFSIIPYFRRKKNYELYVIKLCTRFIITYLYSAILYAGLAAILATINLLFDADISGKFFADMAFIVGGIFAPAFFLADVPRRGEEASFESYPKVLSVLLQFIILPLLSIYTIILYSYFGKLIVTRHLPQGVIGNLVLWYSIVSTIVLFLIYPLRKVSPWIRTFITIFPKAIVPLLTMLFVAIGIRVNAYGIKESRYFVLVVGTWVTWVMIYYAVKKDVTNIFLSTSLAIIAFLSVTGPWSAYSISQISQNKRFDQIVRQYEMIDKTGSIKSPKKEFVESDKKKVSGIIIYFNQYHDLKNIKYLPKNFETSDMKSLFGFDLIDEGRGFYGNGEYFDHYLDRERNLIDIKDFDYFAEYEIYDPEKFQQVNGDYTITCDNNKKEIFIKYKGQIIYRNELEKLVAEIHHKNRGNNSPKEEEMTFKDENQDIKIQIVFKNINGSENKHTDEVNVEGMSFYTFIKFKTK